MIMAGNDDFKKWDRVQIAGLEEDQGFVISVSDICVLVCCHNDEKGTFHRPVHRDQIIKMARMDLAAVAKEE